MSTLFDTHAHLFRPEFDGDRLAVMARAATAGVDCLTCAVDLDSSAQCIRDAEVGTQIWAAVGIHPNDVADAPDDAIDRLRELARHPRVKALGETGLDYHWNYSTPQAQQAMLEKHLELAAELNLPLVLHARRSEDDLLDALEPFARAGGKAVWHCFLSSRKRIRDRLERALDMGLFLGIGGMATFEDQHPLRETIPLIPDRHLLLETDCPFLCPRPIPAAGRRNEPAYVARVAEEVAALRGVSMEDIARITTRNARTLFGLDANEAEAGKIAYVIRDSLYLSLTNQCNNNCLFCARNQGYVVKGHDIHLDHDPDADEVLAAMGDFSRFDEVVFCGFGESTLRLETLKDVARAVKEKGQTVRLNTNGLANLEYGRDIVPELVGLVDVVSVSLNTADPEQYRALCQPRFGPEAYAGMCDFIRSSVAHGLETICTVVEMPDIDIEAARERATSLGATLRVRSFVDAG